MNINLNRVAADAVLPAVELFFELSAREDHAWPRDQRLQHSPFAGRQRHGRAIHHRGVGLRVDGDAFVFEHGFGASGAAADQRAHAGQQLVHVIGFDDVVVGARVQSGDAVADRVARGGDEHRRAVLACAQIAQQCQAVALGQAQIQQDEVVGVGAQRKFGGVAVLDPVNGIVLRAQAVQYAFTDHDVVFDEKDAHGCVR
ncbi:hypothetical protein D3C86_1565850 [compost metagenome]